MRIFREVSLADSLSVLNALFGFTAVSYLLLYGIRVEAFALFYFSTFADALDGFTAKKTGKSPFGKELDSLADSISFGVFPAALMVKYVAELFPFAALYLTFAILRLARFNVLDLPHFVGIPTLAASLFLTSLVRIDAGYVITAISAFLLSILMVSDLEYPREKDPLALAVVGFLLLSAIFFAELCYVILTLVAIYIAAPLAARGVRAWRERRLKRQLSKQE